MAVGTHGSHGHGGFHCHGGRVLWVITAIEVMESMSHLHSHVASVKSLFVAMRAAMEGSSWLWGFHGSPFMVMEAWTPSMEVYG
ncbi:hypothetical protein FH972_020693 [Carpinus fangiana]|uniref:Uncharacterized protein n=1 Tax=Carpinus fangiana TaxID=176857 RepID=A0A5N6RUF3_9ROSI|nr:hypothetical protein FH972_020693 [Carpinus fangiana]